MHYNFDHIQKKKKERERERKKKEEEILILSCLCTQLCLCVHVTLLQGLNTSRQEPAENANFTFVYLLCHDLGI